MITYYNAAENPLRLWLRDSANNLIDFSVGTWTFVLKFGTPGQAAVLTKSAGITGAAGAGVEPTGTPNLVATPTTDEFNTLAGMYTIQVRATTSGNDQFFQDLIQVLPVIT